MTNNREQPSQQEVGEVVKMAFEALKQKMGGKDLIFKDESGEKRFFAISSPAGTINLHSFENGLDYTLWEDGTVETANTSDPDGTPADNVTASELESMLSEIEGLQEEEMEHPEGIK
ncbi:MAG: hypothetical protein UT02_C0002G0040 [Parcubacteria group bacterium GW2011_GWC2_38_7]|nr:MAG: hypothetical protein UT02_C0002G0040 [Parcubacteria group bacterium GW2011_GWC2_38_7]